MTQKFFSHPFNLTVHSFFFIIEIKQVFGEELNAKWQSEDKKKRKSSKRLILRQLIERDKTIEIDKSIIRQFNRERKDKRKYKLIERKAAWETWYPGARKSRKHIPRCQWEQRIEWLSGDHSAVSFAIHLAWIFFFISWRTLLLMASSKSSSRSRSIFKLFIWSSLLPRRSSRINRCFSIPSRLRVILFCSLESLLLVFIGTRRSWATSVNKAAWAVESEPPSSSRRLFFAAIWPIGRAREAANQEVGVLKPTAVTDLLMVKSSLMVSENALAPMVELMGAPKVELMAELTMFWFSPCHFALNCNFCQAKTKMKAEPFDWSW